MNPTYFTAWFSQFHHNNSSTSFDVLPNMSHFIPKLTMELDGLPSLSPMDMSKFEGMMLTNSSTVDAKLEEAEIPNRDRVYPHHVLHSKRFAEESSYGKIENICEHPLFKIFELYFLEKSYDMKMKIVREEIMSRLLPGYSHFCYRLPLPSLSKEEFELFCLNNCTKGSCLRTITTRNGFRNHKRVKCCWEKVSCGSLLCPKNFVDLNDDEFGMWEGEFPLGAESIYKCELDKIDFFYDPSTMAFECSFKYIVSVFQIDNSSWASSI